MGNFNEKENLNSKNEIIDKNENKTNILDIYDFQMIKDDYLIELEIRNYSPNTIKTYSSIIKKFIAYLEEQPPIFTQRQFLSAFRRYIQYLKRDEGVTQNYIYLVTTVVKKYLEFEDIRYLDSVSTPKRTKSLPKSLNEKEVQDLIDSVRWSEDDKPLHIHTQMRDRLALIVLYSTGLRISELVNLKIKNIDFDERTMVIRGKGEKDRIVLFDLKAKEAMLEYLEKRIKDSDYLLVNRYGNHLSSRYIQMMIKKYASKVGIEKKVTPHVLRHSYATHLLKNGVDIRVIQQLLGHTNLSTTQIYTSVDMKTIKTLYDSAKMSQ